MLTVPLLAPYGMAAGMTDCADTIDELNEAAGLCVKAETFELDRIRPVGILLTLFTSVCWGDDWN